MLRGWSSAAGLLVLSLASMAAGIPVAGGRAVQRDGAERFSMGGRGMTDAAQPVAKDAGKRRRQMKMSFVRSGGFAGRATNVEGTITFEDSGGEVMSGGGYGRKLSQAESSELKAAVEAGARKPGLTEKQTADAFQYEVTLVMPDGHRRSANVDEMDPRVGAWVREEAERIWSHRVGSRK